MKNLCRQDSETIETKGGRSPDRPGGLPASAPEPLRRGNETAAPWSDSLRGWILYDGDCRSCTASAKCFDRMFRRRGFHFLPLQTRWVQRGLSLQPGAPLEEMRVLTDNGEDFGGADAVIYLARKIWWAWPFHAIAQIPGMHHIVDQAYRWIAAHRGCNHTSCTLPRPKNWPGWILLLIFPILALLARNRVAPWIFMWLMAGAIFVGCKWLTFWRARMQHVGLSVSRALGYLFAWPGMDAKKFLTARRQRFPSIAPIVFAIIKIVFGVFLLFAVARSAHESLVAGWIGMIGLILIFHFGLFPLAAIGWRSAGVDVDPIMNAPIRATSLSEFWSRRWNGAFNRLALDLVFRPLARPFGIVGATLLAFLFSGLIHELVISLPARGGFGLPTGYFLLQGCGVLAERSEIGKRIRLRHGIRGRIFTIFLTAGPAFWLFHPPFVRQVILPFMKAVHAL